MPQEGLSLGQWFLGRKFELRWSGCRDIHRGTGGGSLRALCEQGGAPIKMAMRHSWARLWLVPFDGELSPPSNPDRRRSRNESWTGSSIPAISTKAGCSTHHHSSPPEREPSRRLPRPSTMSNESLIRGIGASGALSIVPSSLMTPKLNGHFGGSKPRHYHCWLSGA